MKARIIQIGNSKGIRLPKHVLDQVGLTGEVDLEVRAGELVISPASRPRDGWERAAKTLSARNEDELLVEPAPTRFDDEEWEW